VEVLAHQARIAAAAYLEATVHPHKHEALAFWLAVGFRVVDVQDVLVTRRDLNPLLTPLPAGAALLCKRRLQVLRNEAVSPDRPVDPCCPAERSRIRCA
jgi:hypothetical protein